MAKSGKKKQSRSNKVSSLTQRQCPDAKCGRATEKKSTTFPDQEHAVPMRPSDKCEPTAALITIDDELLHADVKDIIVSLRKEPRWIAATDKTRSTLDVLRALKSHMPRENIGEPINSRELVMFTNSCFRMTVDQGLKIKRLEATNKLQNDMMMLLQSEIPKSSEQDALKTKTKKLQTYLQDLLQASKELGSQP